MYPRMASREGVADPWVYASLAEARGGRMEGFFAPFHLLSKQGACAMGRTGRPSFNAAYESLKEEVKEKKEEDKKAAKAASH
ncbi:hypothetical protein SBRCBS47491_001931 [Sporothrix bragantina]|uniref:Uncharacterized protein n=1 Tax=Sporothrix bragantina TaxID=671064 RepID=A0ABP0B2L8_9PEZI